MLQMSPEKARQQFFAQRAVLRNYASLSDGYNTGAALVASDAGEYITYYLAKLVQQPYPETNRVNVPYGVVFTQSTGSAGVLVFEVKPQPMQTVAITALVTPAEMVKAVRNVFLLTVRDAALVLKVSRPTIYQWEGLSDIEQIRAYKDRERLKALYRMSQDWERRGRLTGRWTNETLPSGKSVMDLLTEESIDEATLRLAHGQLLALAVPLLAAEQNRSQAAAKSLKGAFAKMADNEKARRKDRL